MLDWHLCQVCYPLEIKLLSLLLLLHVYYMYTKRVTDFDLVSVQMLKSQIFFSEFL